MPERAPVLDVQGNTAAVQVTAVTIRAALRLKAWLPEYAARDKPVLLAGRSLPSQVGASFPGSMRVLCVGPGEWLFLSEDQGASSLREHVEPELTSQGLALVDLTDGFAALEVRGSAAREVVSKGCGLDLHPRNFPAGRCARTRFAQIPVVLECLDEPPRFVLHVARSYCRYLRAWLEDDAAEFGSTLDGE